jgi:FolB domain-containing protein
MNQKKNNIIKVFEKPIIENKVQKVFIKDLIINKIFGFYPGEKKRPQKLKFNIKLELNNNTVFNDTNLKSIVDYDDIIQIIHSILDQRINFLETLANKITKEIFKNTKIQAIEMKIEKLNILKKGSVGFELNIRRKL